MAPLKLYAISDIHINRSVNRRAFDLIPDHPEDTLILAGDVADRLSDVRWALTRAVQGFRQVIWVPGNHELWAGADESSEPVGVERYEALVALCRELGVLCPEDPYPIWSGDGPPLRIVPLFLLYDLGFRPAAVPFAGVAGWARQAGIVPADLRFLRPDPYGDVAEWCRHRCDVTEARLDALDVDPPWLLINHYPLRRDLIRVPRIARYSPWCGTPRTEEWIRRYPISVVVTGHLHLRATDRIGGVRYEEVSLGYPRHWNLDRPIGHYLREILPGDGDRGGSPTWLR